MCCAQVRREAHRRSCTNGGKRGNQCDNLCDQHADFKNDAQCSSSPRRRSRRLGQGGGSLRLRKLLVHLADFPLEGFDAGRLDLRVDVDGLEGSNGGLVILLGGPTGDCASGVLNGDRRVDLLQAADGVLLDQAAAHAPVKVLACPAPLEALADDPFRLHAARAVVEIRKLACDLRVEGCQLLLARPDLGLDVLLGIPLAHLRRSGALQESVEPLQLRIQAVHELLLLWCAELHLYDACWLKDASPRLNVGIHLHLRRVDGRVDHHPGATTELATRGDVDEDRMLVLHQSIDDLRAKLQDLVVHVARAAREAAPIREDHQWQVLAPVEVADGRRCLVRAVGKPYLAGLRFQDLLARRVGWVSRHPAVDVPRLHSDDTHGDAAELRAAGDHAAAPAIKALLEGALIEETREFFTLWSGGACQHVPGVIRRLAGHKRDIPLWRVGRVEQGWAVRRRLGREGEPI
mmetsp:Transcript_80600/g.203804  ORF Transcript_80600/g.203804 Transcript_80600/m.203804 type:complete len:462 (-) Transcript_80600:1228-2613(-)